MELIVGISIGILVGAALGTGISSLFWKKKLKIQALLWQANFSNCVNQAIANMFGGRVEGGVIYLPHPEEDVETEEDDDPKVPDKDKLN
jgi:hypothetical protein